MGMIILVFNVESYDKYLYLLKKRMLFKEINFEGTVTLTLSHSQSSLHLHPLSSHFFSKTKQSLATPSNLTVKNKTVNNIIHKSDIVSCKSIFGRFDDLISKTVFLMLTLSFISNLIYFTDLIASTHIYNPIFIQQFLKNYIKHPQAAVHLSTSRILPYSNSQSSISSEAIYKMIRYAHISSCQLYLNCSTCSHQTILNWLQNMSNKQVFNISQRPINKENPQQNLLWFNSSSFHHLDQWLANQIQKSIMKFYFNKNYQYAKFKALKKHIQKNNQANSKHLHYLELNLTEIDDQFWKNRSIILDEMKKFQQSYVLEVQNMIINIDNCMIKQKKQNKKHKKQRKNIKFFQKKHESQIYEKAILDIQKKELANNNDNNLVLDKHEQKSINTTISHIQIHQQFCFSLQEQQYKYQQQALLQHVNPQNTQLDYFNKQLYQQSYQDHKNTFQNVQLVQGSQLAEQNNQTCESKKRRKRKRNKDKVSLNIYQQFKLKAMNSLMNKKFNAFVDDLNCKSNDLYQSKIIAFQRVRYFISMLNPQIESILFGSNAVGISLPTSDVDIMLLGLQTLSKEDICDYLAQIAIFINAMGWIISCSTYLNAKVPLLKLEIDTSISYAKPKIKLDYHQATDPYLSYYLDLRDPSKGSIIKVDITINIQETTYSPSTQLMRKWLQQKPSLQRIILAFKYILSIRGYSQNFKGGIGSYSLFIMIAAYFQNFKEERLNNYEIFIDILKFYGQDFENQIKMISISLDNQKTNCYYFHEQYTAKFGQDKTLSYNNPLKIIDPLNHKIICSSFNQYNYIKAQWRRIRADILKIQQKVEDQIYSCFANSNDLNKIYSNQKSFQKWVNKAYNRIEFSIADIFRGIN